MWIFTHVLDCEGEKKTFLNGLLIKLVMHFTAGCKAVEHAQEAHKHILELGNIIYTIFILLISHPENLLKLQITVNLQFCSPLYNFVFNRTRPTSINI